MWLPVLLALVIQLLLESLQALTLSTALTANDLEDFSVNNNEKV